MMNCMYHDLCQSQGLKSCPPKNSDIDLNILGMDSNILIYCDLPTVLWNPKFMLNGISLILSYKLIFELRGSLRELKQFLEE